MIVLHNPSGLLHSTVELLGARLIPALECPERITAIVEALSASSPSHHTVCTINFDLSQIDQHAEFSDHNGISPSPSPSPSSSSSPNLISLIAATHSPAYLKHLSTIFQTWLSAGLVEPDSCILPECFALPRPDQALPPPSEPKDIYARVGYYAFDMSSGINAHSYQAILGSANLALEGVKLLLFGEQQQQRQQQRQQSHTTTSPYSLSSSLSNPQPPSAPNTVLALTRPPGHHCDGARSGGYCYVNNAALAVTAYHHLLQSSPSPSKTATTTTAILDLDFHHGNGTQSIFYHDPSVLYVSIHGRDEFPYYTGSAAETGAGEGAGFNVNLPLDMGSSYAEYARLLDTAIARIREHAPRFLVISLGFDTFELDPLGKFGIETGDYESMARAVRKGLMMMTTTMAEEGNEGGGPVEKALILLEGGYVVDRLGENMLSFLKGWEEEENR